MFPACESGIVFILSVRRSPLNFPSRRVHFLAFDRSPLFNLGIPSLHKATSSDIPLKQPASASIPSPNSPSRKHEGPSMALDAVSMTLFVIGGRLR